MTLTVQGVGGRVAVFSKRRESGSVPLPQEERALLSLFLSHAGVRGE